AARAEAGGVARERIVVDPGFGFAKTPEQNFRLLDELATIVGLGYPVAVGPSRKRFLGAATGRPVEDRDGPTAVACPPAWERGGRGVPPGAAERGGAAGPVPPHAPLLAERAPVGGRGDRRGHGPAVAGGHGRDHRRGGRHRPRGIHLVGGADGGQGLRRSPDDDLHTLLPA